VPLPHGNGEQRLNALPVAAAGGGLILADAELTPDWIRSDLLPILTDAQLVAAMSQAAAGIGHRDTDVRLAAEVLGLIRGGPGGPAGQAEPGRRPGEGHGQHGGRRRQHDEGRGRHGGGQAPPRRYDDPGRPGSRGYEQPRQYDDPGRPGPGYDEPGWYEDPRSAGPGYDQAGPYPDPWQPGR